MDHDAVLTAAREGKHKELQSLLATPEGQAQLNTPVAVNGGHTPLTASVWFNQLRSVQTLVEAGANLTVLTNGLGGVHQTALHYVAELGRAEIGQWLLDSCAEKGCVATFIDFADAPSQNSPLDIAEQQCREQGGKGVVAVRDLLKAHGATCRNFQTHDKSPGGESDDDYDELPPGFSFGAVP